MSDQKYRQRGYREGESESRRRAKRPRPAGARGEGGPRGRGLGGPGAAEFRCSVCNTPRPAAAPITYESECESCGAPLHTCKSCRHFDTGAPNECRAPSPEPIARKAEANRCDLFEPKQVQSIGGDDDTPSDAKSAFDALFDL